MYKYTPIDKVLTFVPKGILEEDTEGNLLKYALQGYNQNVRHRHTKYDILYCVAEIKNYKAIVPKGFKAFYDVCYSVDLDMFKSESESLDNVFANNTIYIQENFNGNTVTIFQSLVYHMYRPSLSQMRYAGQNMDIVHNDCIPYLCKDCQINFSIDKSYQEFTVDQKEGYIHMLYMATPMENEKFLVPDDPTLFNALSYYIQAMHWRDRNFRKEQNANDMFLQNLNMANSLFSEFQKRDLLSRFDYKKYVVTNQFPITAPQNIYQKRLENISK